MGLTPAEIRAVIALAVGMFCVQVDFFALSLALPQMAVDLNQTTTNMQWVLSAYMIAVGAAMIPAGRLGDLRGHRRIVVAGLVVFGGASLVCGLSSSYGLLIGFRALQGLGAAAIFTVSVAAISTAVASDHRGVAIGALYGIANIGTALGPFIGGLLTEQLSWRWVFFLNVPLAAVAILCCLRWLRSTPPAGATVRIDWLGLVLVSSAVIAVAYAADRGGEWGWSSPALIGLLALAVVLLVVFTVVERRVRDPLINMSLFRNRAFVLITVGGTIANIVYTATVLSTTIYLQDGRRTQPNRCRYFSPRPWPWHCLVRWPAGSRRGDRCLCLFRRPCCSAASAC
jgi:MFS family permease